MERFHHFGTVFVKVDREMGKVVLKPCLFVTKSQRLRLCRVTKSRTRATKSRDKIAAVTSVIK